MQCIVRLPWRNHKPGDLVSPADGVAQLLIARGILKSAEAIDRPAEQLESRPVAAALKRKGK